ncbi:MAG TPA: dockerin type I repeat-containing protein [Candidatus Nanoarchaeia archaeon]|nr:dockerin type I repeat-containing protein [Candidatus Nanoarchaeia archaeon]
MMKKIVTSLMLLSLISVMLVGAETSGLSSTNNVQANSATQSNVSMGGNSTTQICPQVAAPVCEAGKKIETYIGEDGCQKVRCISAVTCNPGQIIGDLNGDGQIVASDLVLLENIVAGFSPVPSNICCADVNQDGKITVSDQVKLPRIISGLETSPGKCESFCQGIEYNNTCYESSFTVNEGDIVYTQKEMVEVTNVVGSVCGVDENIETCTTLISSVDLIIGYRCTGEVCPAYAGRKVTLLQNEEVKLDFTGILLKLSGTNVNSDPSTASFEISLPTTNCQIGCICDGKTVTCPSETEPTIITEVQTSKTKVISGTSSSDSNSEISSSKISFSKAENNQILIQSGNVEVVTSEKVSVTNSKLTMQTSSGASKEIKVMPKEVSEILGTSSIESTELKEESEKAVYSISATKKAKIISVFPVDMKIEAKVSAETGEIISINKPWWSFLAKEE